MRILQCGAAIDRQATMVTLTAMTQELAIALAQTNPKVGDVDGNVVKIRQARGEAQRLGADLVVFGELNVCGYPPEDLVLKPAFQAACRAAVETLARETADGGPAMLVGSPWLEEGRLYNAALLLGDGAILARRFKRDLPNYGVFDEKRLFAAGLPQGPVSFRDVRLGVMVCEDMWTPETTETLAESGAELLLVPNGSPYEHEKFDQRIQLAAARTVESGLPIIYVNQIGGQDELVFDGASFALDSDATLKAQLPAWREAVALTRWKRGNNGWRCTDGDGPARLCGEKWFSWRRARAFRRHRFRHLGGGGSGCAGAFTGARRHDALALYQQG
jgi:NAD+ synthase